MDVKSIFNAAVCIIGIAILFIHAANILLKKNRRRDENQLLWFVIFTIVHFATYLSFLIIKVNYKNDDLIIGFYTSFYIMNNMELLFFYFFASNYIDMKKKYKDIITGIILTLFVIYIALDIVNIFTRFFFTSVNGVYQRSSVMIFSQGYQFIAFAVIFALAIFNKKLDITSKIAFAIYCLLPLVAIIIQILLPGYAVAYLSIIVSIEVLFLFVNVRKNMELANEARKTQEAEIKIMMSQIKPHFIYNTLASISTLIKIDSDKAQKALDDFTEYLRTNLSSLTDTGLISFKDELKHVETYLSLEKMRFDERLNIVYDIQEFDFMVPPLSIQPIVENAVKHGIMKKIEGGTVTIKTYENNEMYIIEVSDDGVGFDVELVRKDENKHIGLNNVRYRLSTMCKGSMTISSELDKGTVVTVYIYK